MYVQRLGHAHGRGQEREQGLRFHRIPRQEGLLCLFVFFFWVHASPERKAFATEEEEEEEERHTTHTI